MHEVRDVGCAQGHRDCREGRCRKSTDSREQDEVGDHRNQRDDDERAGKVVECFAEGKGERDREEPLFQPTTRLGRRSVRGKGERGRREHGHAGDEPQRQPCHCSAGSARTPWCSLYMRSIATPFLLVDRVARVGRDGPVAVVWGPRMGTDAESSVLPTQVRIAFAHAAVQVLADRAGVDVLHIKGAALDESSATAGRSSSDADVLVRPEHVAALVNAVRGAGWVLETSFESGSSSR